MDRVILLLSLFSIFSQHAYSQVKVLTFDQAIDQAIDIPQLDTQYPPAIGAGEEVVYRNQDQAFIEAYSGMLNELNQYLNGQGFYWENPVRCFNRFYFNEKGKVDFYLFKFKPGSVSEEKQKEFSELIEAFLKDYQFSLPSQKRFAQCSPVVYQDI